MKNLSLISLTVLVLANAGLIAGCGKSPAGSGSQNSSASDIAAGAVDGALTGSSLTANAQGGVGGGGGGGGGSNPPSNLASFCPLFNLPSNLVLSKDYNIQNAYFAAGAMTYTCTNQAGVHEWVVTDDFGALTEDKNPNAGHYHTSFGNLVWQDQDTSSVSGRVIASDATAVGMSPGAISWVLYAASAKSSTGLLSTVSYIQRLDTISGAIPNADLCNAQHVGQQVQTSYQASFIMYQYRPGNPGNFQCR